MTEADNGRDEKPDRKKSHEEIGGHGAGAAVRVAGELAAEAQALRTAAGLCARTEVELCELTGADRTRFLNGLITCEVKSLTPGQGAYGYFTNLKGRILADCELLVSTDRLWLVLPATMAESIQAHLTKYRIADRVEVTPRPDLVALGLIGPQAAAVLGPPSALPAAPWSHAALDLLQTNVHAVQAPSWAGCPVFSLWVPKPSAPALAAALLQHGAALGLRQVSPVAVDGLRVAAGCPQFGREFAAENFPQELGNEQAVSYTKGCYLGQEVVARIHYRGGVNRKLAGVLLPAADVPVGTALHFEEREAGRLTSVAVPPAVPRPIGLTLLHQRAAALGTELHLEGHGTASVVALPFAFADELG